MEQTLQDPTSMGSLFVVEEACQFGADRRQAVIVLGCNDPSFPAAIEQLSSTDARRLAQAYAASRGISSPCINGNMVGPYPINDDGKPLDKVVDERGQSLPPQHVKMQVAGYQCGVPIAARMV